MAARPAAWRVASPRDLMAPIVRPRRLRATPALRRLVAETRLDPGQLVLPAFVREGLAEPTPIVAMPGVVSHTRDSLRAAARGAAEAGLGGIMLFGVPLQRDAVGSGATDPSGIQIGPSGNSRPLATSVSSGTNAVTVGCSMASCCHRATSRLPADRFS